MREQDVAEKDAELHATMLIRALQDADAPEQLIDDAESVQARI